MRTPLGSALAALGLVLLLAPAPTSAQDAPAPTLPAAPDPVVRTTISPPDGAVVGQHIALYVDVLFPGSMPHPPRVAIPDLPGAQVMRFETQGTTLRDTIDGNSYVGQRFEFAVFPRRGGPLTIPPATITLLDRSGDVAGTVSGQRIEEAVAIPDGIDVDTVVVATDKLTLDQSWQPDPSGPFDAGDALVRTITRTAADIPALAMRDLAFGAPDGVRAYVDDPVSQDQNERGTITGKRVDRVTYVFEKAGSFALPEVAQPWWNLADRKAEEAIGAAATITVAAATPHPVRPAIWVTVAALVILATLLIATARRKLRAWRTRHRAEAALAEPAAFQQLTRACGSGDAAAIYAALLTWRSRLPSSWPAPPPDARPLEAALFAGSEPAWSRAMAHELLAKLRRYRRTCLDAPAHVAPPVLPPLNPS